jgi:c-di-GMP-binding flagellar brake protein YcgR
MLVKFSRTTNPFKGVFIGMEPGSFIILRLPAGMGVHDHLFEGNPVVVKYIHQGIVYGFRSSVTAYLYKKGMILALLAYPSSTETHELRKEQRVDFLVPATLSSDEGSVNGFVLDISPSGCRYAMDPSYESSPIDFDLVKEVALTFEIIGVQGAKQFRCQVKSVIQEHSPISLGLEFDQVESSITRGIRKYVQQVSRFLEW